MVCVSKQDIFQIIYEVENNLISVRVCKCIDRLGIRRICTQGPKPESAMN